MKTLHTAALVAGILLCSCGGPPDVMRTVPAAVEDDPPERRAEPARFTLPSVSTPARTAEVEAGPSLHVLSSPLVREAAVLAFHPTRPLLVVVAVDGTVVVVSSRTSDVVYARRLWVRSEREYKIAFDPGGRHVAISATQGLGQESSIEVLDLDTGTLGAEEVAPSGTFATAVRWLSPTRLAWVQRSMEEERAELVVRDRVTRALTRTEIPVHCHQVFSATTTTLLRCSRRRAPSSIQLIHEDQSVGEEREGDLLAVHPDGSLIAIAGEDAESVLITEVDGTVRARFAFPEGVTGDVRRGRFSADGTRLLVTLGQSYSERPIVFERDGTAHAIEGEGMVQFSADLRRAVRFQRRQLELIEDGQVVQQLDRSGAPPALSASGEHIAISGNGGLSLSTWEDSENETLIAGGRFISLWGGEPLNAGIALYGRGFLVPFNSAGVGEFACGAQGSDGDARAAAMADRCGPELSEARVVYRNRGGAHVVIRDEKLMVARTRRPVRLRLDATTAMCIYPEEQGCSIDMDDAARLVVLSGSDAPVAFNARTGRVMHRFGSSWASGRGLTRDGRLFLALGREEAVLFAARTGRELLTLPARVMGSAIGTSAVVVETRRDDVRTLRAFTSRGEERFARDGFASSTTSLALDEARGRVIRKSAEGVEVLDLATGAEVTRFPVGAHVGIFDGGMFACAEGALTQLDEGGAQVRSFGQACERVFGIVPSENGAFVTLMQRDQATVFRVADQARLVIRRVEAEDARGFWAEREDGRFEAPAGVAAALRTRGPGALEEATVSDAGAPTPNLIADFFSGS